LVSIITVFVVIAILVVPTNFADKDG